MPTPLRPAPAVFTMLLLVAVVASFGLAFAAEIPPPEKQLDKFKLPPGFEVQLVLANPEIGQPMNLNFDARGRLWVSSSVEYPYPAKGKGVQPRSGRFPGVGDHPPRDWITVAAGIGPDGKPVQVTRFAEGLNLPIGVTPIADGSAALAYSIPAIHRFADKDKDGKSDGAKQLYARFGNTDTHGMSNGYTRWIDGWIYGCHGFSNSSEIKDAAGRVTKMRSGNTYRFREDGSHFQQFTWGQVNPFGLTFDPLGNLYSGDCHTKPLYLLLRGAKYPHFGDKPDGLGFGPEMMRHNHGSTGICGPAYYAADHFPAEFRDNLFVCNPVSGRINRDKLKAIGSTYQCVEQPDLVRYEGKLFRPVDCIVGPDGALYIADFCNPVIGHYEAPLDHPDRDRTHGRVWRIIYRGRAGGEPPPERMPDMTKLDATQLVDLLADSNLQVRTLATNYLVDEHANVAAELVLGAMKESQHASLRAHGLWILERLGQLDDYTLHIYVKDKLPLVRVHAMRILAERETWSEANVRQAELGLFDGDAFVRRAAADAMGRHPTADFVAQLLVMWERTPAEDTHLIHTIRLALRQHLRDEAIVAELLKRELHADPARRLVEIAAAADSDVPLPLLLRYAKPGWTSPAIFNRAATQIARRGSAEQLDELLNRSPQWFAGDDRRQIETLVAIADGLRQKGVPPGKHETVQQEVRRLAPRLIKRLGAAPTEWTNHPVPDLPKSASPWGVRRRASTDGDADALFWDSIAHGERLTGILRGRPFAAPRQLSFWMCGHNGHPNTNNPPVNHVRLVDGKSGEVLAKEIPPRHDTARKYTWNLEKHVGKQVTFEIVDAHQADAYAWVAVGRFEPAVVRVPSQAMKGGATRLVELIGECGLREFTGEIESLAGDPQHSVELRVAALASFEQLAAQDALNKLLMKILADVHQPDEIRGRTAMLLGTKDNDAALNTLGESLASSHADLQRTLALALLQTPRGRTTLLDTIAAGKASPRLLQDAQIAEQLNAIAGEADKKRIAALTKNLPPVDAQFAKRMQDFRRFFVEGAPASDRGPALFKKHCAACHRIGEEGGMVGPQLDGIGERGFDRLLEDVLDPNRNVDVNFRTTIVETQNGKLISGLERRREGQVLVLADAEGKELQIPLAEIAASRKTNLSLMPANLGKTIPAEDLRDVIAWLLKQRKE